MTTGPGTGRLSTSEAARRTFDLAEAFAHRAPSPPESSVEIGVTAKRLHTWTVTVRGEDVNECARVAQRLDDELAAKYAHELEAEDDLAAKLAASVAAQDTGRGKR